LLAFYALYRLASEASTIFINIRWLLITYKMTHSKLFWYNGLAGLVVFFACRVATIPPFWYMMYYLIYSELWPQIPFYCKCICIICSIVLDSLNAYWFYRIMLVGVKMIKVPNMIAKTVNAVGKPKVSTD
jgi:hypothetical protein